MDGTAVKSRTSIKPQRPYVPSASFRAGRAYPGSWAAPAAPVVSEATVGLDVTGNGKAEYIVSGIDENRDGIPDALQSPWHVAATTYMGPLRSGHPYAYGYGAYAPGVYGYGYGCADESGCRKFLEGTPGKKYYDTLRYGKAYVGEEPDSPAPTNEHDAAYGSGPYGYGYSPYGHSYSPYGGVNGYPASYRGASMASLVHSDLRPLPGSRYTRLTEAYPGPLASHASLAATAAVANADSVAKAPASGWSLRTSSRMLPSMSAVPASP